MNVSFSVFWAYLINAWHFDKKHFMAIKVSSFKMRYQNATDEAIEY